MRDGQSTGKLVHKGASPSPRTGSERHPGHGVGQTPRARRIGLAHGLCARHPQPGANARRRIRKRVERHRPGLHKVMAEALQRPGVRDLAPAASFPSPGDCPET